ncbi:MAG: hypothetical protein COB98_04125 [Flavobacteriaceae bacterium]|nr:MAG: hypothetical protein COB98_04125 [Flavobacteriaceae bacterium]
MRTYVIFVNKKTEESWELSVINNFCRETIGPVGKLGGATIRTFKTAEVALEEGKKRIRIKVTEGFVQQVMDPMDFKGFKDLI